MSYATLDATELARAMRAGERGVRATVEEAFARIEQLDGELNAFVTLLKDEALQRADELEAKKTAGEELGPLFGVPVALKANMCLKDAESNCSSRMLAGYRAPYSATFVQRLLDADAVPVGMTNMDEFAMGSSSENSAFGVTRNPWDPQRIPGGSSSGSAVAVASGMVPLSLGSDTGGSVRQPAAMCGIHGLKPTYGMVSRYGLIAFGSSLDQVSPFSRSVRDMELCLEVLSGHDPFDSTSIDRPPFERADASATSLAGLKIGVPREYFPDDLDPRMRAAVDAGLDQLVALGAERVEVSLPHTKYAIPAYYVIATAEASSNLARYEGVGYGNRVKGDGSLQGMFAATREAGFGDEVKRRILLGTYVLSAGYYDAWYGKALKVRRLLRGDFDQAFEEVDLIVGPTSPTPAFPIGERAADPVSMYLADSLTTPISLAGLPAISTPCGFVDEDGRRLPVGMQIVGPPTKDARVLLAARLFERETSFSGDKALKDMEGASA